MSDRIKHPTQVYSFDRFSRDNPIAQQPGDRLDAQFSDHASAINQIITALNRDEARLVGKDDLAPDLLDALTHDVLIRIGGLVSSAGGAASAAQAAAGSAVLASADAVSAAAQARGDADTIRVGQGSVLATLEQLAAIASAQAMTLDNAKTAVDNSANDSLYASNLASDYAVLSGAWAEYMPTTIPPNILAIMDVTGDHWSSRWWANRSANAFGMLAWWYQGAWPSPGPPSTPNTPTGQPLPPGSMYFNTTLGVMMVWNGSTWVNAAAPQKGVTATLYYIASAGQTVFPLATTDRHGKNFTFNQTAPEGIAVGVNGVRLEPTFDFTVDTVASSVTFLRPLTLNALVAFDLLTPASQLTPSGTVNTVLLSPITPNGVQTAFTGLTVAMNGHPANIAKNEELQVSVNGIIQQPGAAYTASLATITFSTAPEADAVIFIVWFGPANP